MHAHGERPVKTEALDGREGMATAPTIPRAAPCAGDSSATAACDAESFRVRQAAASGSARASYDVHTCFFPGVRVTRVAVETRK